MKVRFGCMFMMRGPKNGMPGPSTCESSITSPVLMSRAPRSTTCGFFMWLPEPFSSPAPHFDGQRWLSGGTFHWAETARGKAASKAATQVRFILGSLLWKQRLSYRVRSARRRIKNETVALHRGDARRHARVCAKLAVETDPRDGAFSAWRINRHRRAHHGGEAGEKPRPAAGGREPGRRRRHHRRRGRREGRAPRLPAHLRLD